MKRVSFVVEARSSAPPEQVFSALADSTRWKEWAPMVRQSTWEREGTPAPGGVGAVRKVGSPPVFSREEIVEYEPPRRMVYVVRSGFPIREYRAEVVLSDGPAGGTDIIWRGSFFPPCPGTGPAFLALMRRIVGGLARGLADYSAT
jgi:uncharacterized protein YndB with AHSA1/START domain